MFSTNLNTKTLRNRFSADRRLRIENVLDQTDAVAVYEETLKAPYELVYVIDGKTQTTSKEKMDAMSLQQKQAINDAIKTNAQQGVGYLYGSCHLGAGRPDDIGAKMVSLFEQIQDNRVLDLIRKVTGDESINDVSGHFTRFLPGHFLTRHIDVHEDRNRKFAYVLSLTPQWHPDWGGLLQFYEQDGAPRDAWSPVFNSLCLFDVKHVHAVTYVTPFAPAPRLSLTGWFKSN